jgi:hypothetical protein
MSAPALTLYAIEDSIGAVYDTLEGLPDDELGMRAELEERARSSGRRRVAQGRRHRGSHARGKCLPARVSPHRYFPLQARSLISSTTNGNVARLQSRRRNRACEWVI